MTMRRPDTISFPRLFQLAATFLVVAYMLLINSTFYATLHLRVQLLNALAGTAIALIWLTARVMQHARVRWVGLELPLLAFALSQFIATGTSAQPRLSLEAVSGMVAWSLSFIILCDLIGSGWPRAYIVHALVVAAGLIMVQALWEVGDWFALWARLGQFPPTAFRLTGFLGHANLTAAALNLLLPLVIAQFISTPKRAARVALAILGLGMLAAEFFSSSRAGWVAVGTMLTLFLALLAWPARERLRPWLKRMHGLSLPARLGVLVCALTMAAFLGWLLVRQSQHATHGDLFLSRQGFWNAAWSFFISQPLTGSGPGLYPWLFSRTLSIPPNEVPLHAHSLIFQVLSDSGLLGLGALTGLGLAGTVRLWRRWSHDDDRTWTAALLCSLFGALLHQAFDYFFGFPGIVFLFVLIAALAFASPARPAPSRVFHPALLGMPLALILGMTAYTLRGTWWNGVGLQLAAQNNWEAAAQAFRRAADADPGLTLYWEAAAQANTRAGNIEAAIPLWERAARDEPYWSVSQATLAVLTHSPEALRSAIDLAPASHLLALNVGVLRETAGDPAARDEFLRALDLNPQGARALFWQQTPLRAEVLAAWRAERPADTSPLAQGWAALESGDAAGALRLFEEAHAANPLDNQPYLGLARAYWALGNEVEAEAQLRVGQNIPVYSISQTIEFYLLLGDWAAAHGERPSAIQAYTAVFNAYNNYGSAGPGSYGYPWRSWVVFHRAALPTDLVPQFVHADITAEMDARFAQLAQWYVEAGQHDNACYVLARVRREAPVSQSGRLWETLCP